MAIYCIHCGTQLPDIATFCLKCGKPVKGEVTTATEPGPQWEYCEVVCKNAGFLGGSSYLEAKAVGAMGVYSAARSTKTICTQATMTGHTVDTYAWGCKKKLEEALNELITLLSEDGWQPAGRGEQSWEYTFRRQVRSSVISSTDSIVSQIVADTDKYAQIEVGSNAFKEAVIKVLEETFAGKQGTFLYPNIPEKKFMNAIRTCQVDMGEQILGLIDCTVFGSAKECILFGTDNLYCHEAFSTPIKVPYSTFPAIQFAQQDQYDVITSTKQKMSTSGSNITPNQLIKILHALKALFTNIYKR